MRSTRAHCVLLVAGLVMTTAPATAQPLNPNNFTTIAASFAPTAAVTIDTDALAISGTGFTTVNGVTAAQQNGGPTLAVFDFGSINIPSGVTVSVFGSRPFALLSQSSATVAGTITLAGANSSTGLISGAVGVAGGGYGGNGDYSATAGPGQPGAGVGGGLGGLGAGIAAGGGGFGGAGGTSNPPSGGIAYGNLLTSIQAGSGGGGGSAANGQSSGRGGAAGGGAMQLGAISTVAINVGSILANGGSGLQATGSYGSPGAGSGGGIILTGSSVTAVLVNCSGGGNSFSGGGGGRFAVVEATYTIGDSISAVVAGGTGGTSINGQLGVRTLAPTTTVVPVAQSLTVTSNTIPNFEQFVTSNYNVAGTLTLSNSSQTINTLTGTGSVTLTGTTLTVGAGDASGTFSGNITGNGGITKIGLGTLTLTGTGNTFSGGLTVSAGTVQGSAASLPAAITDNGNVAFNESGTVTYSGSIFGTGSVTKLGTGTLTLGGLQVYSGGATIAAGTLNVADDTSFGAIAAPVTVQPLGALTYTGTTTTARTFTLYNSPLSAGAGATVTLNGATVAGGVLAGPGSFTLTGGTALVGMTTRPNTALNLTGAAGLTNVTNGAALVVAPGLASPVTFTGFTNQGSGTITIGANSQVNAADFQSYGMLILSNGTGSTKTLLTNVGTSPIYFNGGSQTFIGTVGGNGLAQLELNGQNAIVAGGLLVNNGHVTDSSALGNSTIIAEYGALVKGAGQYDNSPITQNGGKFQAGNSPGVATVGRFVFGPGGVSNYVFAIDDATGQAGPTPDSLGHVSGWGLVKAATWQRAVGATSGDFVWSADTNNKLTVSIDTLVNPTMVGTDVPGLMADFDPSRSYSWPAVEWVGAFTGPTSAAALNADTAFDTSGFLNPVSGTFGWSLDPAAQTLSLTYTPSAVPEPGTLALTGMAALGWVTIWRRRWQSNGRPATLSA